MWCRFIFLILYDKESVRMGWEGICRDDKKIEVIFGIFVLFFIMILFMMSILSCIVWFFIFVNYFNVFGFWVFCCVWIFNIGIVCYFMRKIMWIIVKLDIYGM